MAPLPIEILPTSPAIKSRLLRAVDIANEVQSEFQFQFCSDQSLLDIASFASPNELETNLFLDNVERSRTASRGYHPFLMGFTDALLNGRKYGNLFGSVRADRGVAVVTFFQVDTIVGPDDDSYTGYALYYFGRYGMSFISPSIKNHNESRQCIYDLKAAKHEIIDSMRAGALCDNCRAGIWSNGKGTVSQMESVNRLIEHASSLVHKTAITRRPNVFIGSSSRNVSYARALKRLLEGEFRVQVWDEDQVFR